MKGLLHSIHPILQLLSALIIMILVMFVTVFVGVLISIPFAGSEAVLLVFQNASLIPENLSILRYLQILQGIGLFIIPGLLSAYLFSYNPKKYLGLEGRIVGLNLLWILGAMICIIPLINYIGFLNESIKLPDFLAAAEEWMLVKEEVAKQLTMMFVKTDSVLILAVNIVMIAVLPAIGEEFIFRGLFQRIFIDWSRNIHVGVWTAAFLFSAMHMQFYGFMPRLLLGALLGYVYVYSGNIWYAIWLHFINNGAAVLLYFLSASHIIDQDVDAIGADGNLFLSLLWATLGTFFLIQFFRKQPSLVVHP